MPISCLYMDQISCNKYKKCIKLFKSIELESKNEYFIMYKIIELFFNNKILISDLDKLEIYDVFPIFLLIKDCIANINIEIRATFEEEVIEEKSAFDDFDKENGYDDQEDIDIISVYDSYIKTLNNIFDFAINECGNSLTGCLDMSIIDLLDYIKFKIEDKESKRDDV